MSTFPIKTPFSDLAGTVLTHQVLPKCADFEMRYVDCLEAYGFPKGEKLCMDYYLDMRECVLSIKQNKRVELMREERLRQYKAGERTRENLYRPTPKHDIY